MFLLSLPFPILLVLSLIKNIPPIVRTTIAIFLPALTSESLSMDLPGEIVSKLELIDNDCCFNITNVIPIKIIPTTRIAVPAITSLYPR